MVTPFMPGIPCNAGLDKGRISHYNSLVYRGMAKFGIALGSGPRGLGFESRYSDHGKALEMYVSGAFSYFLGISAYIYLR